MKTGHAQSSRHGSGEDKDPEGSLSYRAEVLHVFSSLPSPVAFPTCLCVVLSAAWHYKWYSYVVSTEPGDLGSLAMDRQAGEKFGPMLFILAWKR